MEEILKTLGYIGYMGSIYTKLILGGMGITAGSIVMARSMQPQLVFMPPKHYHEVHHRFGDISYTMKVRDTRKIIIYSHGNGEDICTIDYDGLSQELGYTVVTYDYPGYGLSAGIPDESGCIESLSIITNHIMKQYPNSDIIQVGRSLGTGVLVQYAYRTKWKSPIVLLSPFKSIGRVLCDSSITDDLSGMFRTCDVIDKLICPVKIIHGTRDKLVPCDHGQYLYSKLQYPLEPVYKNCGHNDLPLLRKDIIDILSCRLVSCDSTYSLN